MDEQRLEAYANLIEQMLQCLYSQADNQLSDILLINEELIDRHFLLVMGQFVKAARQNGEIIAADFLEDIAALLFDSLRFKLQENIAGSVEDYQTLGMKLVQAETELLESEDSSQQSIYSILELNLNLLDMGLLDVMQSWAERLITVNPELAEAVSAIMANLSLHISEFPLGNHAINLEIAIGSCQAILILRGQDIKLVDWAKIQVNLGNFFGNRIQGNHAENIELAIAAYQNALQVYTPQDYPMEWSSILSNLGCILIDRVKGIHSENVELAIVACQNALLVSTNQNAPVEWASAQNNLGLAFLARIQANRAENIELAIDAFQNALGVRNYQDYPTDWAKTQTNLGLAFTNRIRGDRVENIELAINAFQNALEVITQHSFPMVWAIIQDSLGIAVKYRIRGDRAENIELSIAAYRAALEVRTQQDFPIQWAQTQNNLGIALCDRIRGDRAENIELSIAAYYSALEVTTRQNLPKEWAQTQHNLGIAFSHRIQGDRAKNIELAIASCCNALEVRTRQDFPIQWAQTQNNLGIALCDRIRGDRAENLNLSIAAYHSALEIINRLNFPQSYTETQFNLGLTYIELKCLSEAKQAFDAAIQTVEFLRGEIISGDETKRKINEEWNKLYANMVEVCVVMQDYQAAVTYAERGKSRNLIELISTKDLYPQGEIPDEIRQQIQVLRQQIYQESLRLDQMPDKDRDTTYVNQLQQEFQNQFPYQPTSYSEIQSLTTSHSAILEWYIIGDRFMVFVLTGGENGTLSLWQSSSKDQDNLIDWASKYLNIYRLTKLTLNKESRVQAQIALQEFLSNRLIELTKILHLDEIIKQYIPIDCEQLILIPHKFLHLFPLHTLPLNDGSYLIDRFPQGIRYAPSCQILQRIQQRQQPTTDSDQRLLAICNPTKDLDYTDLEVDAISKLFKPSNILKGKAATKDSLHQQSPETAQYAHFSCHGYFNFENPLQSALLLAGCKISPLPPEPDPSRYLPTSATSGIDLHKCLTLEDIFRLDLRQCRLVVLSACETGITDVTSTSDEYIGLPSAFLYAGASNVVSSLWSVSDLSTAFLMIRFYEYFQGNTTTKDAKDNAAMSLKLAQQWLRDSTKADLQSWSMNRTSYFSARQNMQIEHLFEHSYKDVPNNQKIFASPFYWAAFQAIGK